MDLIFSTLTLGILAYTAFILRDYTRRVRRIEGQISQMEFDKFELEVKIQKYEDERAEMKAEREKIREAIKEYQKSVDECFNELNRIKESPAGRDKQRS